MTRRLQLILQELVWDRKYIVIHLPACYLLSGALQMMTKLVPAIMASGDMTSVALMMDGAMLFAKQAGDPVLQVIPI